MSLKTNQVHFRFSLRLAILYTLFLALSFVVMSFTTYQLVRRVIQHRDHKVIQAQAEQFKALFAVGGVGAIHSYFNQQINPIDPIFVRIVDRNNKIHFITGSHPLWDLLDQEMKAGEKPRANESRWDELAREESEGRWMVATHPLNNMYYLQVGRSTLESQLVLEHFRSMSIRILVPALFLSLFGGWIAARRILSPLRELVKTTQQILETGDHKRRVPTSALRGEMGTLSRLFNRVLDQNELLVERARETLDNVAHDLRTPMTHLRNAAEHALQQDQPDLVTQREALSDCMEESEQILNMLNTLMDLAEAHVGGMVLKTESISLRELTEETVELYSIIAEERNITLHNEVPTYLTIEADYMRLRQCLANLLDNALKYSDEHSTITLSGDSTESGISLSIQDEGCGIKTADLERIWDRLYRCEHSRSASGLGLGLSMVSAIAKAHGGHVHVASELWEGSTFTIYLPRKKVDA